ncbi:MAG: ABC transporter ATP-binding protein/permease [Oscillospiraceae bacterium]|nr:ABC transporter ATP-binding protein/permease [Oscillospiraceae bacterium]
MSSINNNQDNKIKMSPRLTISHNWFMIKTIFRASPLLFILQTFDSVRWHGMNFIGGTIWIGFVLESVEFRRDFSDVVFFTGLFFGLSLLSGLYSAFNHGYVTHVFAARAEQKLRLMLYDKARSLDLSCYDEPNYYNEFVLSVTESKNAVERTTKLIDRMITGLVIVFAYGTFFLLRDPVSMIFVVFSFIARVLIGRAINKLQFKARISEMPFVRKRGYIHRVFYLNDYAKELRLNKKVTKGLHKEFDETNDEIYKIHKGISKKKFVLSFLSEYAFSDFIFDGLYLTYLVFMTVLRKTMSFGTMFVLHNAVWSMRRGMIVLSELLPSAMENALYIDKIRTFTNYENKIVSSKNLPVPKDIKTIEFKNVSFCYTDKQDYILKNINLVIEPFNKIALVGYNGAGKTTLIKLLMRLYDPVEGIILLDGIDIRDFNLDEYRQKIGTIFQDFRIYAASVAENIAMDLISTLPDADSLMTSAVELSGFKSRLLEMSEGFNTPLTREFEEDGTALSGGESQKLATARVFYKTSDLIILDEPSSALDPIAEYQMNRSMNMAAKDKSVVFISHRLSTTKHANKIFMLDKGEIIEEGTHEELLHLNGKYNEMWSAQASRYV